MYKRMHNGAQIVYITVTDQCYKRPDGLTAQDDILPLTGVKEIFLYTDRD